ncbi:MAG: dipeptidase [Hyphomonadaceae bacterium]|nr:dipeptidase [Hyphomonadaceae bacterium]
MRPLALAVLALAAFAAPALAQTAPLTPREDARIERVLRRSPVIDGHNDLPWELKQNYAADPLGVDLTQDTRALQSPMHTDIPRLRKGGVGGQFWSVYVPASLKGPAATLAVMEQIDLARRIIARYPAVFERAETAADIVRIQRAGRIASLFGMEGGEAINGNLALLREFRAAGVLYMTLTHSTSIDWVDSATDAPKHGGLSPFGEDVVREMNRIGMLVDLSHVSADAMKDALRVSRAPVIFSHSSAFGVTPHPRNVPDDVLAAMPANGGVVMINFNAPFVSSALWRWTAARAGEEARLRALHPGDAASVKTGVGAWEAANPRPTATVKDVADHVVHVARVAGVDHVGLGGDYDGVTYLPEGMEGVDGYRLLLGELARRGWSDADLGKLTGGNILRAMRAAERVARDPAPAG